jgi:Circularly permuted ATP-grasp type 2
MGRTLRDVAARSAEADAVSAYHHLLHGDPEVAHGTASVLEKAQRELRLTVGGRPLCIVLRPRFVGEERHAALAGMSRTLANVFERAGTHIIGSGRLLDRIGAGDAERAMWEIDPGYPGFTLTSRLDSFMVGSNPAFVEYNAESPAGIGFFDVLAEVFDTLPAAHVWRGGTKPGALSARACLLESLLWAYSEWGGSGKPTIAIIDWEDVVTRRDFEICGDFFRAQGCAVVIVDPRRLEYRGGAVWCGSDRIHLVYRRVLLHELLEKTNEVRPLLDAYRDGAVCMVNSPRSKLLHKKSVFALLSAGELEIPISEPESRIIQQCIPWTRMVEDVETVYGNETWKLDVLLASRQDRFALKPIDDYGGRGVVLGWDVAEAEWRQAIERAMTGGFVAQERVPVPQEPFPMVRDGKLVIEPLYLDANPLLFRGEMGGVLTRLSGSALLNVTAGTGSAAATLVLKEIA